MGFADSFKSSIRQMKGKNIAGSDGAGLDFTPEQLEANKDCKYHVAQSKELAKKTEQVAGAINQLNASSAGLVQLLKSLMEDPHYAEHVDDLKKQINLLANLCNVTAETSADLKNSVYEANTHREADLKATEAARKNFKHLKLEQCDCKAQYDTKAAKEPESPKLVKLQAELDSYNSRCEVASKEYEEKVVGINERTISNQMEMVKALNVSINSMAKNIVSIQGDIN